MAEETELSKGIRKRIFWLQDERHEFLDPKQASVIFRFKTWYIILMIFFMAFVLRMPLVLYPEVVHNDSIEYIRHAKEILNGNWTGGIASPVFPAFISFVALLTKNFELAGIWVSVIFGALLVLPVFSLARAIFNEKIGILSALLAAVHPFLYIYSGSILTESTYYFLLTTSVYFGWEAFREGRIRNIFLFGLFSALAYLVRPEGIGLVFVFSLWVLLIQPPVSKRSFTKRVGIILLAVFCFLAFTSPYLIQLKKETGTWGISKKASLTVKAFSEEERDVPVRLGRGGLKITLDSFVKNPLPFLGRVGVGFLESLYRFQQVYHPLLFILAVFGWVGVLKHRAGSDLKGNFYILSHHIFFFGLVLPFFWVERRYVSQMVAMSLPWAAFGCLEMRDWVGKWFAREPLIKRISLIAFLILLSGMFIQGSVKYFKPHQRLIRKEAGLWMKANLPCGGKIMSRLPQEAFYAELEWSGIPRGSYEEILRTARTKGIQYLIIDGNIDETSPGFLENIKETDLVLVKKLKRKSQKMTIFKVVYSE